MRFFTWAGRRSTPKKHTPKKHTPKKHTPKKKRNKQNYTNQLKAQLGFYLRDLQHEKKSLAKAKSYRKWKLPGVESMIRQHERGVKKSMKDIKNMKARINMRYRRGEIFKIV